MPQGKGTYGTKKGRPPKEKKLKEEPSKKRTARPTRSKKNNI